MIDWWDGPLCGLTTYKNLICVYERIFDENADDWRNEYYLTPIEEDAVNLLLKHWDVWCKTIRSKDSLNKFQSMDNKTIYNDVIESSPQKRAYKRAAVFYGRFHKDFIP